MWAILAVAFNCMYNVEFRSYLIAQKFEDAVDTISDIDFWNTHVALLTSGTVSCSQSGHLYSAASLLAAAPQPNLTLVGEAGREECV